MKILYLHQYFSTPNGIKVTRAFELSKAWAKAGHEVTVLTTSSHLVAEDMINAKGFFIKKLNLNGCRILAFNIPYSQKMGKVARYLSWIAFLVIMCDYVLFCRKYDLIWARSTPLTTGIPALIAKRIRKIKFIFEVTDQWPEVPIEMGAISNRLLIKLLLWLEKEIYKYSDVIVTCSPGMTAGVEDVIRNRGLSKVPIHTITNFSETDIYKPENDGSSVRKKNNWNGKKVFLHAGTMGRANSLDFVLDVAEKLSDREDILFVLVGEGNEKSHLQQRVNSLGLDNIEIRSAVKRTELPETLAAADVIMVIFCDIPIIQNNSANKFFDALACGKPVLLNYSGWQRSVLENNNAGFGVDQYSVEEFVEKVLCFVANPDLIRNFEVNARDLAESKYSKSEMIEHTLNIIKQTKDKNNV